MTRILLYSDEPILAKGLESVLRQVEGFELLPTCNTVAGVVDQVSNGAPDLVLMDLTPEITFAVLSELKHAMASTRIVLWVNSISTELAFQAMGLGVRGILRKTLPTDLQVKCLQKVQAGELWFEKALTAQRYESRCFPHFNLGRVYEKRRQWRRAMACYARAIIENPEYETAKKAFRRLQAMWN